MTGRVLIIDDEPNIRRMMETIHRNTGWETASAEDGEIGLAQLQNEHFDVVYLDLALGDRDGIDVLKEIRLRKPDQVVIILTGHGSVEKAVEAIKLGAFDFLEKDFGKEKILITSRNALERCSLARENRMLRDRQPRRQELLGKSESIKNVLEQVAKVAPTNARVLIRGESGTGKELIAREIHERSKRSNGPFVKINCAAIPEDLIEAELFGSVKGAYTGSVATRVGKFEEANGGTLFLDEIGDMSLRVQTKLLRVLQEGELEKIGDNKTVEVDVRVIAATNKNLDDEVSSGRFREDLYFRINVVPIVSPPLRSHPEDIPLLVNAFLDAYCAGNDLPRKILHPDTMKSLEQYSWPGNIRELRNQVERMVIMSAGNEIRSDDLATEIRLYKASSAQPAPYMGEYKKQTLQESREQLEKTLILQALEQNDWNVTRAAEELGLERSNLHKKMKNYGIAREE